MRTLPILFVLAACGDDGAGPGNAEEVITTVTLEFVPMGGGTTVTASFDDPDSDGGDPPVVDPINLTAGTTYTTSVRFLNKLEDPPEEITDEVRDEGEDHQVFFTGTAVGGPLAHTYLDMDLNGLPIGLSNRFVATAGTGTLIVTLRHLPPVNGTAVKSAGLADQVRTGGFAAIGGSSDANVEFMTTVP